VYSAEKARSFIYYVDLDYVRMFFFGLLITLARLYPTLTLYWFLFLEAGAEGQAGAERAGLTVAATADSDMPPVSPRATSQGLLLHAHEGMHRPLRRSCVLLARMGHWLGVVECARLLSVLSRCIATAKFVGKSRHVLLQLRRYKIEAVSGNQMSIG
jgi:hypothetical protein